MFLKVFLACFCIAPMVANTTRKFQSAITQQNLQTVLLSIEERLRNLDAIYSTQYSPSLEGKLDKTDRQLDTLEKKLTRLESLMNFQFDKISENISNKHFKDDITKDHILRKMDSVYERLNHRVVYLEMKIEMGEKKVSDILERLLTKFEKMEDTITARGADIEVEITDILTVMDEIKSAQYNVDMRNITDPINKSLAAANKVLRDNFIMLEHNMENKLRRAESGLNATLAMHFQETQIRDKNVNNTFVKYISELMNVQEHSIKQSELLQHNTKNMAGILNTTRIEQQNGMRSLIVQLGRLGGKNNVLSDSNTEKEQFKSLGEKIDANFENIMILQNLFLESCHKIQMDETQLESKISEVLEKLIDTFEQKSSQENNNIHNLEKLIKSHDSTVRRNLYTTSHSLGNLKQDNKENQDELTKHLLTMKGQLVTLCADIENLKQETRYNKNIVGIVDSLKAVEFNLGKINRHTERNSLVNAKTAELISSVQVIIKEMLRQDTKSRDENNNHMKNINNVLHNFTNKIDSFQNLINKHNGDHVIQQMESVMAKFLERNNSTVSINTPFNFSAISNFYNNDKIDSGLSEAIQAIFGVNFTTADDNITYEDPVYCNEYGIDIRNGFNNTQKCGNKTAKNEEKIEFVETTNINCTDINIDVRNGINIKSNCTYSTKPTTTLDNNENIQRSNNGNINCLDVDIDVRNSFNKTKKCENNTEASSSTNINCTGSNCNSENINFGKQEIINCTDFDIDIRINSNSSRKCGNRTIVTENISENNSPNISTISKTSSEELVDNDNIKFVDNDSRIPQTVGSFSVFRIPISLDVRDNFDSIELDMNETSIEVDESNHTEDSDIAEDSTTDHPAVPTEENIIFFDYN